MRRSRTAFALGVVVLPLVLGGCSGDDPEPKFAPPESTSPTESGSPSSTPTGPVEPTMPAAARRHTVAGAQAFVKFYWEMVNYAQATGDLTALQGLGSENCQACKGGVAGLKRIFKRNGEVHGGKATLSQISGSEIRAGNHHAYQVTTNIHNERQTITYPDGSKDQTYPAGTVSARFIVDPTEDGLVMALWTKLA